MASYNVPMATPTWQTLAAPSADAWLQPVGGSVYVSTDASPDKARAGIVSDLIPYPVASGVAIKVACVGSTPVPLRMWDK